MFKLPRRPREAYDESRTQIRHLTEMENRIMSALEDAVAELQSAISNANSRFQNVGEVEAALVAERAKYDELQGRYTELVSTEEAEDVQQAQEVADARAATDAAVAASANVAEVLSGLADQVEQLGTTAAEASSTDTSVPAEPESTVPAEDGTTDEAPVDTAPDEAPATTDVSDQVAATEATDTEQTPETQPERPVAAVDQVPQPGNAAPVPATGGETPAVATGPTDADGNPVDAPSV